MFVKVLMKIVCPQKDLYSCLKFVTKDFFLNQPKRFGSVDRPPCEMQWLKKVAQLSVKWLDYFLFCQVIPLSPWLRIRNLTLFWQIRYNISYWPPWYDPSIQRFFVVFCYFVISPESLLPNVHSGFE